MAFTLLNKKRRVINPSAVGGVVMMVLITCIINTYSSSHVGDCGFTVNKDISCMDSNCNVDTYALALKQSFGFFTDIPEDQWRIAQEIHAKTFPNHFRKTILSFDELSARWYAENFQEEFHCAYSRRIPSNSYPDGPKWICDPHRIAKQEECLVYSFGCFGNVEFERGIKEEIGEHCEIHTFDIVANNTSNGDFKGRLDKIGVNFHNWGLGTEMQADAYARTQEGPPLHTLAQTMAMLGHTGRVIDIFKIDCESCEWDTYAQFLEGVFLRQLLVETHRSPMPKAKNFFYELHDAGYVIFSKEANYLWGGNGVEYAFLKLHRDFFIKNTSYSSLVVV